MAEPLDNGNVELFLNFINDGTGMVLIDEPIGFDAANFVLQQDDDRYGRDVSFAGGDIDLEFDENPGRYESPLNKLLFYNKIYGFESQVEFIIRINYIDYVIGELDFQTSTTNDLSYFKCTIIQQTKQALLKRRLDIKIDLFSNEDIDGNIITPISTEPIFLKNNPILQQSSWFAPTEYSANFFAGQPALQYNFINAIQTSGIKNTLSYFPEYNSPNFMRYITAQTNLSNVVLNISNLNVNETNIINISLYYRIGFDFDTANEILLVDFGSSDIINYNNSFNLQNIFIGQTVWIYFIITPNLLSASGVTWQTGEINISVISKAINSIVNGVLLTNAINQVILSTTGMNVIFSDAFLEAVENQYIFTGYMLRGFNGRAFTLSFEDLQKCWREINADYQIIDNNNIFIGLYSDLYNNIEIGAFEVLPSELSKHHNKRYTINKFNFKYNKFENDRDENNTIYAVHTETEWNIPNIRVENKKIIEVELIRDAFLLESTRSFNIVLTNSKSLKNDDDTFIIDTITQDDNIFNSISGLMNHTINNSTQLLITNDGSFSFLAIGIVIGMIIIIPTGYENSGSYPVLEVYEGSILLDDSITTPTETGQFGTIIEFYIDYINFEIRTNEGFDLIQNDGANGAGFANLRFTPKRNILNFWGQYLNTACGYRQDGIIRNTYYKSNGELITQFSGGVVLEEQGNILVSDLQEKILSPDVYIVSVLGDFTVFDAIQQGIRNNRGFIRIIDNNEKIVRIHPQKLEFFWADNRIEISGEARFESNFMNVDTIDGLFVINEVGYSTDIVSEINYRFVGDFLYLYDDFDRLLTNAVRYDFVIVNGIRYASVIELAEALDQL